MQPTYYGFYTGYSLGGLQQSTEYLERDLDRNFSTSEVNFGHCGQSYKYLTYNQNLRCL